MKQPGKSNVDWIEPAQRHIARMIATSPAGHGLLLIGGFRYRLLDTSVRRSLDLDYHWSGNLAAKQKDLHAFCERRVLPDIRRTFSIEGDVRLGGGPGEDSPFVKVVELALWKPDVAGRVEIPIDITSIPCLDKPTTRSVDGALYLTASDEDMAESKILALLLRPIPAPRDVLDVFLFQNRLAGTAPTRLRKKIVMLKLHGDTTSGRVDTLRGQRGALIAGVERVIREQVDTDAARTLHLGGGAELVVDTVLARLDGLLACRGKDKP